MEQYKRLVEEILRVNSPCPGRGRKENTRGGVDTISLFNYNYYIDLFFGAPVLTTKEISWKNIVIENLWFLSGSKDIDFLHHYGVKFWDPWADEQGNVPSAYGNFWRHFDEVDQVSWALETIKNNPNTRQAVVSAWDPRNASKSSLPPCHTMFVLNVQADGRLNLHLTQRSCDVALGLPYNLAGYGAFLLPLFSRIIGREPGIFAHSIVDAHIYVTSLDGSNEKYDHRYNLLKQIDRECRPLPTIKIHEDIKTLKDIDDLVGKRPPIEELLEIFKLENYNPHPPIYFKPAV